MAEGATDPSSVAALADEVARLRDELVQARKTAEDLAHRLAIEAARAGEAERQRRDQEQIARMLNAELIKRTLRPERPRRSQRLRRLWRRLRRA